MTINPDDFRTVDQWGRRFYIDPLPACEIAPATTDKWPSVSVTKKAWDKPFLKSIERPDGSKTAVGLDALRAADYVLDSYAEWSQMTKDQARLAIATAPARDLAKAGQRGTGAHTAIECLSAGLALPIDLPDDTRPYLSACERVVTELRPTPVLAETVAINRTLGVGGTFDMGGTMVGFEGFGIVDWKTRAATSQHGCYEEEVAQLGIYSAAEYVIVDELGAVRRRLPEVSWLAVVSIRPDGYEVFPVDVERAREAGRALVTGWHLKMAGQRAARAGRGKPLPPSVSTAEPPYPAEGDIPGGVPTADVTPATTTAIVCSRGKGCQVVELPVRPAAVDVWESPERQAWIRGRVVALVEAGHSEALSLAWPPGVPTLKEDPAPPAHHINLLKDACHRIEAAVGAPFGDNDPAIGRPPSPFAKTVAPATQTPGEAGGSAASGADGSATVAPASPGQPTEVDGQLNRHHPDVVALVARLEALPLDLRMSVAIDAKAGGIGNIQMGVTSQQLAIVRGWTSAVETQHEERKGHIASIASDLRGVDDELWDAACRAVDHATEPERWTLSNVEDLTAIVAAVDAGMVGVVWDDNAMPRIAPAGDAADRLVAVYGAKKAVLETAKEIAVGRGAKSGPRSTDDAAADPILVAHLVWRGSAMATT